MPPDSIDPVIREQLKVARHKVASWLRDGAIDGHPLFVLGHSSTDDCPKNGTMADRFCHHARQARFELVVNEGGDGKTVHWEFEGRPVTGLEDSICGETLRDSRLLACAALLESAVFGNLGALQQPKPTHSSPVA